MVVGREFEGYDTNNNTFFFFKNLHLRSVETYRYSIQKLSPCCASEQYFSPGRAQRDPPSSGGRRARKIRCSQSLRQLGEPEAIVRIIQWRHLNPASSLSDPPSSGPDWLTPRSRIQTSLQWWRCSYSAPRFVTFADQHISLPCCFMLVCTFAN